MKRTIKFLLVAVLTLGSTALFAQKFGRIDYSTTLQLMPEMATVQTDLQRVRADYEEHIESMQVEANRKMDELSKLPEGTSETSRQLKNREIVELQTRIQEYYQVAQQGMQEAYMQKILPLKTKLDAAVKKVCKAQGIVMAFQTVLAEEFSNEVVYIDDTTIDINAAVRAELGIAADAVLPAAPAAPAVQ